MRFDVDLSRPGSHRLPSERARPVPAATPKCLTSDLANGAAYTYSVFAGRYARHAAGTSTPFPPYHYSTRSWHTAALGPRPTCQARQAECCGLPGSLVLGDATLVNSLPPSSRGIAACGSPPVSSHADSPREFSTSSVRSLPRPTSLSYSRGANPRARGNIAKNVARTSEAPHRGRPLSGKGDSPQPCAAPQQDFDHATELPFVVASVSAYLHRAVRTKNHH